MMNSEIKKTILFFAVMLLGVISTFSFTAWRYTDSVDRVKFSLTNQHNETITNRDLWGKHLIVFFGYTSCPDICPSQLFKLNHVYKKLDNLGISEKITPVFISIDPERDTHERIKSYLSVFHPGFMGLTGTRPELKHTTDSFNTLLQSAPDSKNKFYTVAHSSLFYIVDQYGRVVDHIPYEATISHIVQTIQKII